MWFDVLYKIVYKILRSEKNSPRYCQKCPQIGLHVKYLLSLSGFNESPIFSTDLLTVTKLPNFMKIRSVGTELFRSDGLQDRRTDMTKLIGWFSQIFANEPPPPKNPLCNPVTLIMVHGRRGVGAPPLSIKRTSLKVQRGAFFAMRLWIPNVQKCESNIYINKSSGATAL